MKPFYHKILTLLLLSPLLTTQTFSTSGHTFPIEEDNPAQAMLHSFQEEGALSHNNALLEKFKTPTSIKHLSEATEYRAYYFDPTYTFKEEIKDHQGNTLAAEGQKINPIKHIGDLQDLILFDGTNPSHILWAETQLQAKWILIKGSPIAVEEETNHPTYFDQLGAICHHFRIEKIPCKITKKGDLLLIEEIPVEQRRFP